MPDSAAARRRLLVVLSAANFVVGMGAFVVVGILTPVAEGLGVSAAAAGWMMTAYALVYALSSPLLVALTGSLERRDVLAFGLLMFGAGAAAAALAPGFGALLAARAVMAVGGGLVTPVGAAVAVGLSPPADRGRVLAAVFFGLTLAQVLGVPAGAWLGYAVGWQAAFAVVAGLAALVGAALLREVPRAIAVPPASLAALGAVLVSGWRMAAVAHTVLFLAGIYCVYTFFAALMEARLGLGRDGVSAMLLVFGLGAVAGNLVGGRLADRIGAERTLALLCLAQAGLLPLVAGTALPLAATVALVGLWSVCGWSFMAPQQARLAALDPPRTAVLLALNAAAIYVAASLGALVGGAALDATGSFAAGGWIGAAIVLAALGLLAAVPRLRGAARS